MRDEGGGGREEGGGGREELEKENEGILFTNKVEERGREEVGE